MFRSATRIGVALALVSIAIAPPAAVAQPLPQRLVVFEGFYNPG